MRRAAVAEDAAETARKVAAVVVAAMEPRLRRTARQQLVDKVAVADAAVRAQPQQAAPRQRNRPRDKRQRAENAAQHRRDAAVVAAVAALRRVRRSAS